MVNKKLQALKNYIENNTKETINLINQKLREDIKSLTNIELIEDEKVKEFVGKYKPEHYLLNAKEPMAIGPLDLQAYLFEHKYQQAEAMKKAKDVILKSMEIKVRLLILQQAIHGRLLA